MTTIRDFSPEVPRSSHQGSGRERANTWHTRSGRSSPEHVRRSSTQRRDNSTARDHAGRASPPARDSMARDRRGSVVSRVDSVGSNNEGHLRHRRLERTNTVKTYHSSEPEIDVFQQPGAEPGIDVTVEDEKVPPHLINLIAPCDIQIVDFSETRISVQKADNGTLFDVLEAPKPEDTKCRWINVNGLSWDVIKTIGNRFRLHRLAIEDLIHTHSRTKVDWYSDQAMIVLTLQKLVRLHQHDDEDEDCPAHEDVESMGGAKGGWWVGPRDAYKEKDVLPRYLDRDHDGKIDEFVKAHSNTSENSPVKDIRTLHRYESSQIAKHTAFMEKHSVLANEDLVVSVEQVSIFLLADNTIVSFFEHSAEDIETPILQRLMSEETVLRSSCDASLVLQAIIDAIVDLAMPVRNAYNKARKELQVDAMTSPNVSTSRALHIFGEEIDMLQNLIKPIVHLVNALRDHNTEPQMSMAPLSELILNHGQLNTSSYPVENKQHKPQSLRQPTMPMASKPSNKHLAQAAQLRGRSQSPTPRLTRQVSEIGALKRNPDAATIQITPLAHTYFGDVLDHCITLIQSLEQMDASASNISTLVFNTVQAKTNNFMAVLAIVTVFYAPLTVVSGYFGMNFAEGAGLKHDFKYYFAIAIPITAASMLCVVLFVKFGEISEWAEKKWKRRQRRERKRRVKR